VTEVIEDFNAISKTEDEGENSINKNTEDDEKQDSLGLWGDSWKVKTANSL
jgi:hypothetical protein